MFLISVLLFEKRIPTKGSSPSNGIRFLVIVVSFLFGMNFTRQGETYEAASHNNILFEGQKDMDVLDRNMRLRTASKNK